MNPPPPPAPHRFPPPPAPPGPPPPRWDAPPPRWAADPSRPAPAAASRPNAGRHLRRALDWNVREVRVTPREQAVLTAAGVAEPRLQSLLAWRRSSLLVALPVLLLSVVLAFVDAVQTDTEAFTELGVLCVWLPPVALLLAPLGAALTIVRWTEVRATSKLLVTVWGLSIVVPLLVALAPLDLVLDVAGLRAQVAGTGGEQLLEQYLQTGRFALAIGYALALLPVVVSVPGGVLKGAARVKSLFPTSALPGWFLVAVAPFYSMFVIVVFVLIDQLVGNLVLLAGVALLAFTPMLFVIYRKHYARAMTAEQARHDLGRASRIGGVVGLAGVGCVAAFVLTAQVNGDDVVGSGDGAYFSYLDVIRTAFEIVSRGIFTSVVFCLIFLGVVFAEWRSATQLPADVRREHEAEMLALSRYAG